MTIPEDGLMMRTSRLVCVGGPCDGERHLVPTELRVVRIPIFAPMGTVWNPVRDIRVAEYQKIRFSAGDLVMEILGVMDDSPEETLRRLIEGYAPTKRHKEDAS